MEKGDKQKYLWPDEDDTFHAFSYDTEIPKLNERYLQSQGEEIRQKAENLFYLVKLDNVPLNPAIKDRRYAMRNEVRNYALESKKGWNKVKKTSQETMYLRQIEMLAKASGFFSIWMNVFQDDMEVKKMFISAFKGTKEKYCLD